jgi:hypothetical protein
MLTPAQYASDAPGSITDVQRKFTSVSLRLFYSGNTTTYPGGNTPGLAGPPTISRVDASSTGGMVTFSAHVVGDPSAGIQQVWVNYMGVHPGTWDLLDLTQDSSDSTLWRGTAGPFSPAEIGAMRFIVQGVNGVGLVTLDDNQGSLYRPDQIAPALQTSSLTSTTLHLSLPPASGPYSSSVSVSATLTAGASSVPNELIKFSIGGSTVTATTNASGAATVQIPLVDLPGPYSLSVGFDGDTTYASSADSSPFTISKLATTLALSGNASIIDAGDTGMSATLKSGGVGLPQRTVAFVLTPSGGPAVVQTRITDLNGKASLGVVPLPLGGTYTVQAWFGPGGSVSLPDDPVYVASSSGTSQLTVALAAVMSITRSDANPTNAGTVHWTVTFNTAVTGVTNANFALAAGGNVTGAGSISVSGNGATRTVSASTGTGDGTLGLNLSSIAGITDGAGGPLAGTKVGEVYNVDKTKPTVTYTGNAGTYTVDQQVVITCVAADPPPYASGIQSTTCANVNARADTLGTGSHNLSATATDNAGNTGNGSTSFNVTVNSTGLTNLTVIFIHSSAKYQSSTAAQKTAIDHTVAGICNAFLGNIRPGMNAVQKAQLIAGYKAQLNALVSGGWLTAAQAAELSALTAGL